MFATQVRKANFLGSMRLCLNTLRLLSGSQVYIRLDVSASEDKLPCAIEMDALSR